MDGISVVSCVLCLAVVEREAYVGGLRGGRLAVDGRLLEDGLLLEICDPMSPDPDEPKLPESRESGREKGSSRLGGSMSMRPEPSSVAGAVEGRTSSLSCD